MSRLWWMLILGVGMALAGCGRYPGFINSPGDFPGISKDETHVRIGKLAASQMPALAKFRELYEIDFEGGATDAHLLELAKIPLPRLAHVVLTDCPEVSDAGAAAMKAFPALRGLGLRDTGVTDAGCLAIAAKMKLTGINVEGSPKVTVEGLLALARMETLQEFSFSLGELTQADLLKIIEEARAVNHMELDLARDAERRLDLPALRAAARAKNMTLLSVHDHHASAL